MKNFYLYPICLIPMGAFAATTFYYDRGGVCDGLFLNPNATLCSQAVTRVSTPTISRNTFAGYWAGDTKVIDAGGNILIGCTAASSLFESSSDNTNKIAVGGFYGGGEVLVKKRQNWKDMYDGWYTCSAIQFQKCAEGDVFYVPYAPNCWTWGSYPNNDGYDYVFNSWRMADGEFYAASTDWHNQYPNGISTGNSYIPNGCVSKTLGDISTGVSDNNIYPFACKLFSGTRAGTWSTTKSVEHGTITLDNGIPGRCTYNLACENGYHTSSGSSGFSCIGTQCKSLIPDNHNFATCVVDEPALICPDASDLQSGAPANITVTAGTHTTSQCKYTLSCPTHYTLTGPNSNGAITCTGSDCASVINNYSCTAQSTFTCPEAPAFWVMGGTVTRSVGTNSCSYTLNCSDDFSLYSGDSQISKPKTITCNGDNCTDTWLSNQLSNYSCWYNCPPVSQIGTWDANGTIGEPVHISADHYICNYEMTCNDNFDLYRRYSDGYLDLLGWHSTYTCNNFDCVSGLSQLSSEYNCFVHCPTVAEVNTALAGMDNLTVTGMTQWPDNYYLLCSYYVACLNGYTLNLPSGYGCEGGACRIDELVSNITSTFQCTAPTPQVTCPDVNDLTMPDGLQVTYSGTSSSGRCMYTLSCTDGYADPNGLGDRSIACGNDNVCSLNTLQNMIDSITSFQCKKQMTQGQCSAQFTEGPSNAGTITGRLSEHNTKCTFTANCDLLQCDPGDLTNGNAYCQGTTSCDNPTDCVELVNKYASVSCTNNECPSISRLNSVIKPNINNVSTFRLDASNPHSGAWCYYAISCDSGYNCSSSDTCNARCMDANCRLNHSWWQNLACTPNE